jgi:DNA-binding NarL/FixJ family response regulator
MGDDCVMALRVLIVDDHDGFRASARMLLEAEGLEVVGEAASGAEALRMVEQLAPHVVLLDVGLPDVDGFEVARAVTDRADPPCVVMVSSRDASDFGDLVEQCGASGFVTKADLSREVLESCRVRR